MARTVRAKAMPKAKGSDAAGRQRATTSARITSKLIDVDAVLRSVEDHGAGGIALFLGTVRDNSEAGSVSEMIYEAYVPMAEKRMAAIEQEVKDRWPVKKIVTVHRIGKLSLGDVSVAVAVSTPHRAEAFEACRHAIERIKHDVPIWKKEKLADGSETWVEGQPMTARPIEKIHSA